jgi:hypothetical protein
MYRFIVNETSSFTHTQKLRHLSQRSSLDFEFITVQANKSSFMLQGFKVTTMWSYRNTIPEVQLDIPPMITEGQTLKPVPEV